MVRPKVNKGNTVEETKSEKPGGMIGEQCVDMQPVRRISVKELCCSPAGDADKAFKPGPVKAPILVGVIVGRAESFTRKMGSFDKMSTCFRGEFLGRTFDGGYIFSDRCFLPDYYAVNISKALESGGGSINFRAEIYCSPSTGPAGYQWEVRSRDKFRFTLTEMQQQAFALLPASV